MKTIITMLLITILVLSMFGFFYKDYNHDNKEMQDYQMNNYWMMGNRSIYHNYNMMNNNFRTNSGMNHNSMSYIHHGM